MAPYTVLAALGVLLMAGRSFSLTINFIEATEVKDNSPAITKENADLDKSADDSRINLVKILPLKLTDVLGNETGGKCSCQKSECGCCVTTHLKWFRSVKDPAPVCGKIPETPIKVCVKLYDLSFKSQTFHGCVRLTVESFPVSLGCFNIPIGAIQKQYQIEKMLADDARVQKYFGNLIKA